MTSGRWHVTWVRPSHVSTPRSIHSGESPRPARRRALHIRRCAIEALAGAGWRSPGPSAKGRGPDSTSPPFHEPPVVLRRVDADARLVDDADGDRISGLEDAELLELLGGLERGARQ